MNRKYILIILYFIASSDLVKIVCNQKIFEKKENIMKSIPKNKQNLSNDKQKKIILFIFAGRKPYLEINNIYLFTLLKLKKISEIHYWQYTQKRRDVKYLESIANLHYTSSYYLEYRKINPYIKNNTEFTLILKGEGIGYILINGKTEIKVELPNIGVKKNLKKSIVSVNIFIKDGYLLAKFSGKIVMFSAKVRYKTITSVKIHGSEDSNIYWDYAESNNIGIKLFDTMYREINNYWYESYEFYLSYDFDIILKCDDDIVFIDLNRFDEYISYISNNPDKDIIFANMYNERYSYYHNVKYEILPREYILKEYRYLNFFPLKKNICFPCIHHTGKQATIAHKYFISNYYKIITNNIEPKKLIPDDTDLQQLNICFFGLTKQNYNKIYNYDAIEKYLYYYIRKNIRAFDKETIDLISEFGSFNTNLRHKIPFFWHDEIYANFLNNTYFYSRFCVVHFQSYRQIGNGLDLKLLKDYTRLANQLVNINSNF